ncbi:MAG: hypothetical protein ACOC1X_02885 [Promethearchaeota archaeon]
MDADVLIHLAKLNQLNLLKTQFSKILITDTIYNETVIQGLNAKKNKSKKCNKIRKTYRFHLKLVRKAIKEVKGKK